jgi:3-methyl-2-oxobutanoate hydroxymethyltransferase
MKHNIKSLQTLKVRNIPITWLTCYDYSFAAALELTSLDMILVGDSGGMVALGYSDTVPVKMEEMIQFASAVRRGAPNKFIVGDMPKGSYEASDRDAVTNAMRFLKEAGCDAIKLEGGTDMAPRAKAISKAGIPVIGHIGLTPQSSASFGGYRVVGKSEAEISELRQSIESLESAGAFAILLEATPQSIAKAFAENSKSIIFGIGAGRFTNGQLLILHDLLGLYPNFRPKFAKCYVPEVLQELQEELGAQTDLTSFGRISRMDGLFQITIKAVERFTNDVRLRLFPDENYSYKG